MSLVSAKTEYACVALFELAARYHSGEPVRIRTIAEQHGIPSRFLVQILLQLKGAGLVASTRGAAGGYRLAREPGEINLAEVKQLMEGSSRTGGGGASDSPIARALALAWGDAQAAASRCLSHITLATLVDRARQLSESMYYI